MKKTLILTAMLSVVGYAVAAEREIVENAEKISTEAKITCDFDIRAKQIVDLLSKRNIDGARIALRCLKASWGQQAHPARHSLEYWQNHMNRLNELERLVTNSKEQPLARSTDEMEAPALARLAISEPAPDPLDELVFVISSPISVSPEDATLCQRLIAFIWGLMGLNEPH